MNKIVLSLAFLVGIIVCFQLPLFAQQDQLTITTYYPSPSGSYGNLGVDRLGVNVSGDANGNQVAVDTEFAAMRNGDAHLGWSMLVGAGGGSGWAYDEMTLAGETLPGDGVVLIKNGLKIGTRFTDNAANRNNPALDVRNEVATADMDTVARIQNFNDAADNNGLLINTRRTGTDANIFEATSGAAGATTSRFFIRSDGLVGVNTNAPNRVLEVRDGANAQLRLSNTAAAFVELLVNATSNLFITPAANAITSFQVRNAAGTSILNVDSTNSRVGINTAAPTVALDVAGDLTLNAGTGGQTGSIRIPVTGDIWKGATAYANPDYVFDSNYKMMNFKDLKQYVAKNKHLPNMPSTAQLKKEGVKLYEQNRLVLEKLEEAYLYIIKLEDRVAKLETEVKRAK
ncbi:MAG: hypothetical protein PHG68_02575 [Candidatus Omnitrophica bacterium]|nr:hypothetical protein [Candidatus Omnitrophota bacterium]